MNVHHGHYIRIIPENYQEATDILALLELLPCTWDVQADGVYTVYPVNADDYQDLLAQIQAL